MEKIDYEITVDVQGMSVEEKKKVQDAYFKLGIEWQIGGKDNLVLGVYCSKFLTNKSDGGELSMWLMIGTYDRKPTHTFKQLMELAGMDSLQDLNSDELRAVLTDNTDKVNKLLLQNDEIVEVLRSRALAPIVISQRNIPDEPKPLSTEDLMKGEWWMGSATEEDQQVFKLKGLPVENINWGGRQYKSCSLHSERMMAWLGLNYQQEPNEIHRIGTDFYWGAPAQKQTIFRNIDRSRLHEKD